MARKKLCKRCVSKGLEREVLRGDIHCQYCRFVLKRVSTAKRSYGMNFVEIFDTGKAKHNDYNYFEQNLADDFKDKQLKEIMSARSRFSSDDAEANSRTAKKADKSLVWQNSITLKFSGNTLEKQATKARKYIKHDRFIKLTKGFPIKPIKSLQNYREALERALEVDPESRAANFAYLKLLDLELARYEQKRPDECKLIWISVCNDWERRANLNKRV